MHIFNAIEVVNETRESIAFLQELIAQQEKVLELQQELEAALMVASQFDLLDHESARIQERIALISDKLVDLIQYKVDGSRLKSRDLIPVLIGALNSQINTLVSIHCGTPQPCTHCGTDGDDVFIC
jgi:hypothetical protein